jgi:hypothetical protein
LKYHLIRFLRAELMGWVKVSLVAWKKIPGVKEMGMVRKSG